MSDWQRLALCKGADPKWVDEVLFSQSAAQAAKVRESHCAHCIVRPECLAAAMQAERGQKCDLRWGAWGGLSPAQRHSIDKRGHEIACEHGSPFDPLGFLTGELVAADGCTVTIQPIPELGDEWNARHTKLAEKVVAWLIEHTQVGERLPSPSALAKRLKARDRDMPRVYAALIDDGTIGCELQGHRRVYTRASQTSAMRHWQPRHLAS